MAGTRTFGISSHLYHNHRLSREHLLEIAAHGFDRVEVFATRTHFDFGNPAAVADLQEWLADAGLMLHGVHAPIGESFASGRWGPPLNIASPDAAVRGDLEQVLSAQPVVVIQVRRDAKRARSGHWANSSL